MESFGEDLETLRRVPLAEGHVARMRAIGSERAYSAGETVLKVGQPLDRFIYIIEGEIEPVDSFSGQRLFNAVLGPTQFIGDIGFLSGAAVTTALRSTMPTRTLELSRPDMLELMANVPELSDHVLTVFAARRRRMFDQIGCQLGHFLLHL